MKDAELHVRLMEGPRMVFAIWYVGVVTEGYFYGKKFSYSGEEHPVNIKVEIYPEEEDKAFLTRYIKTDDKLEEKGIEPCEFPKPIANAVRLNVNRTRMRVTYNF